MYYKYYAINITLSVKSFIGVFGEVESKSGIIFAVRSSHPSKMYMLESYHVMKLQDFLSSNEFRIKNKSKVDESNIEVRNWTKLNLVG